MKNQINNAFRANFITFNGDVNLHNFVWAYLEN